MDTGMILYLVLMFICLLGIGFASDHAMAVEKGWSPLWYIFRDAWRGIKRLQRLTKELIIAMSIVVGIALCYHTIVGWPVALLGALLPIGVMIAAVRWDIKSRR